MANIKEVDFDPFNRSPIESALLAEGVTGKLADVARSIYQQESGGGRNTKTSNAGAVGGMQIKPATFSGVADPDWNIKDPVQNARAGVRYLAKLDQQAGGDPVLTAAGYYGGPGGLEKARRGVAVSDPRNPGAPNTLQYGQQVAVRVTQPAPAAAPSVTFKEVDFDPFAAAPAAPVGKKAVQAANPNYQAGRNAPGALQGFLSGINGPLLGFGDEVAGAVGGVYDTVAQKLRPTTMSDLVVGRKDKTLAENYRANRDFARGAQDFQREENPWTTGITQLMTSAPLGAVKVFSAPAIGQKLSILKQTGQAATTGAGFGGIGGAGNSTADTVGGVAVDAVIGGGLGAALSGGSIPLGRAIRGGYRNVYARLSPAEAARQAQEKVAEALVRDFGSEAGLQGANPAAVAGRNLGELGEGAVIADSSGQSTRALLDQMASLPGETKNAAAEFLKKRAINEAPGLISSAESALGTGGQRLAGTIGELSAARETAAQPIYAQLRRTAISPTAELQAAVKAADELGAVELGRKMATSRQQGFSLDMAPRTNALNQTGRSWNMGDLDHVKQGLDQLIAKQWDAAAGKLTPLGSSYQQLKNNLVNELDSATTNPQTGASLYKSARDAYAGPSALIDAAQAGQRSISQGESAITQSLKGMSLSEQEAFRVGAFEALRQKIGTSLGGRTELLGMDRNPAVAEKIKAIFGSQEAFDKFAKAIDKARTLRQLQGTAQGSKTFERQFGAGDLDMGVLKDASGAVGNAASGNLMGAATAAANFWNRVKTPEPVRNRMGQILLSGGAQGQNELSNILELTNQISTNRAMAARGVGTTAGVGLNAFLPK